MQNIRRIVVPIDFSSCSRAAIDYATFIAAKFEASIDLLHVWEPGFVAPETLVFMPGQRPGSLAEFAVTDGGRELQTLLTELELLQIPVKGRLESGPVAKTIVAVAEEYDLIVMGTHGRTGLSHLFLGSVAERVVRLARRPVITVRAPGAAVERRVGAEVRS